jgi:endo-1,4-beta-xylanase
MANNIHEFTRRDLMLAAVATVGVRGLRPINVLGMKKTLREMAEEKGISFGSAVSSNLFRDAAFASLIISQCGIAVPENALKWAAIRPTPDQFDFAAGDALYEFSKSHGILFRGHTLVWHGALPSWFANTVNEANAKTVMQEHISAVMRHYAGKIKSWDVVNEAVWIADKRPDGLRITPWLQFIGPEYIETAFHTAHEADPGATLVYNDYFLETEDAAGESKRRAVWTMIAGLKKRGVPIHALGIQSHLVGSANVTGPNFKRFLQAISDLGLDILVTELDVDDRTLPADVAVRDRLIATQYFDYLSFMLQFKATKAVLTWGLSDRYSWLVYSHQRSDGRPNRPLPYDAELEPTPARDAIRDALDGARRR